MQVVTIAVYIYFMSLMFAYQHDQEQKADFFLLVPACMQLFFYIGWLKACFILYSLRFLAFYHCELHNLHPLYSTCSTDTTTHAVERLVWSKPFPKPTDSQAIVSIFSLIEGIFKRQSLLKSLYFGKKPIKHSLHQCINFTISKHFS